MHRIIAISAGRKKRKVYARIAPRHALKFAEQILEIDVRSLAAKTAGQRP